MSTSSLTFALRVGALVAAALTPSVALTNAVALAAAPYSVTLEDVPRDDNGPGSYVYPSNQAYRRGSFDLRSVTIHREEEELVFVVKLGADIWKPPETRRSEAQRFVLENGIYVQHVDIYIDHTPGAGFTDGVPGRNITIDPQNAWDVAVVLTPRPFLLKSLIDDWAPSKKVLVPSNIRSYKNVVEARVPVGALGATPGSAWGYAVTISGAVWENTFDAFDRLIGVEVQNALTMPVVTVAEPLAFGGGELEPWHPFVVDIIVPDGATQAGLLRSFDAESKRLASVRAVYPDPEAHARAVIAAEARSAKPEAKISEVPIAPESKSIVTRVREVDGELVVLERPDAELNPFSLGDVSDAAGGQTVARVVVTAVYPKFVLATVVEGAERISVGALVRFSRSP